MSDAKRLVVAKAVFDRLEDSLRLAGMHDVFLSDTEMDLTGLVLVRRQSGHSRVVRQASSGVSKSDSGSRCLVCDAGLDSDYSLGQHIRKAHGMSREEYHLQYIDPVVPECARDGCGNKVKWDMARKTWRKYCSRQCFDPSASPWARTNTVSRRTA